METQEVHPYFTTIARELHSEGEAEIKGTLGAMDRGVGNGRRDSRHRAIKAGQDVNEHQGRMENDKMHENNPLL